MRQRAGYTGTDGHRPRRVGIGAARRYGAHGRGATSKVRCVDVAALFAAGILVERLSSPYRFFGPAMELDNCRAATSCNQPSHNL